MPTFEEQIPWLWKKELGSALPKSDRITVVKIDEAELRINSRLDKQKVKEAIEKNLHGQCVCREDYTCVKCKQKEALLKELGI